MSENEAATEKSGENHAAKPSGPRVPRSIRFSDSEWASVEREARARGTTAAELVRHAAVSAAADKPAADSPAFPPEVAAQIERIYRGVYLLSTLRRDEMLQEGRHEEYESIRKSAQDSQATILNEAPEAPSKRSVT
ncbi:MAG: hypothetical protein OXH69_23110 [Acidobacteria bacterium]|nr:hypothetical protein [Acidobacteriota bacterium]